MTTARGRTADGHGPPLEVRGLTKRFGPVTAVDDVSFVVQPGRVTGFLGPNGAGKTTTLRMLLGLVRPTAGQALVGGRPYAELERPQAVVGAALEASDFHPGRTGRDALRVAAVTSGTSDARVDEVLALVGLADAGRRRVGGYSLGMRQRLGLAVALLPDPPALVLDEPSNGLDPEGIAWLRGFLRSLAGQGRTVLVSSHLLSEVQQTVDEVVILSRGRLVLQAPLAELGAAAAVRVLTPSADRLEPALRRWPVRRADGGALLVEGASAAEVGRAAFEAGVEVHELRTTTGGLEDSFLELVGSGRDGVAGVPR